MVTAITTSNDKPTYFTLNTRARVWQLRFAFETQDVAEEWLTKMHHVRAQALELRRREAKGKLAENSDQLETETTKIVTSGSTADETESFQVVVEDTPPPKETG